MNNFDWEFYINYYPDLRRNGINNKNSALLHWIKYGIAEGRIGSADKVDKLDEDDERTKNIKNDYQDYCTIAAKFHSFKKRFATNSEMELLLNKSRTNPIYQLNTFIRINFNEPKLPLINNTFVTAKIFLIVNNEIDIIEHWLKWHGEIFGYENLYVVNHKVDKDDGTLKVLRLYEKDHKINLWVDEFDFANKWRRLTEMMNDNRDSCNFLVPLDADEFICLEEYDNISVDKDKIKEYFEELQQNGKKYKFTYEYNLLEWPNEFIKIDRGNSRKTFFPSSNFIANDPGSHHGFIINGDDQTYNETKLRICHFEMRSLEHFKKKIDKIKNVHKLQKDKVKVIGYDTHWKRFFNNSLNSIEEYYNEYIKTGKFLKNRSEEGIKVIGDRVTIDLL